MKKYAIVLILITKKILFTLLSVFIFYLVGRYWRIATGINDSFIYLQYPVLCIVSLLQGPFVGALTGIAGHSLIYAASEAHIAWNWVICSGFFGLSLGIISKYWLLKHNPHPLRELITSTRIKYAVIIMLVSIISFMIMGPLLAYGIDRDISLTRIFHQGIFATLSNGLTSVLLTDLFFSSFRHTLIRRILAVVTLLNALVMISYGNMNIGSIILYIITILFGLYLFFYKKWHFKSKNKWIELFKKLVFIGFVVYTTEMLFLAIAAYANKPRGNEQIAIVLGAGLNNTEPSTILKMRLDTAYEWALEDDNRLIITSGGQGRDEVIPEGEAMRNYLLGRGISDSRVIAETRSVTTDENFRFSRKILNERSIDYDNNIIFVTNSFHCYRAGGYARRAGFNTARGLAAPTPTTGIIPNYLREGLAYIKYLLSAVMK